MSALDTAAGGVDIDAAHGPAFHTPLSERNLRVWRTVAQRGRRGFGSGALREHFAGQIDEDPLKSATKSLRAQGYLRCEGTSRWSTWFATGRVPLGQQLPADPDADEAGAADDDTASAQAATAPPPQAGNPFAAAGACWPFHGNVIRRAGAAPKPKAETPPPPHTLEWKRPAAVVIDDPQPPAVDAPADAPRPRVGTFFAAAVNTPPCFALYSDGRLLLQAGEIDVVLPAQATRALFAWLDRLASTDLSPLADMVECAR